MTYEQLEDSFLGTLHTKGINTTENTKKIIKQRSNSAIKTSIYAKIHKLHFYKFFFLIIFIVAPCIL